jgi:hypothetical protein
MELPVRRCLDVSCKSGRAVAALWRSRTANHVIDNHRISSRQAFLTDPSLDLHLPVKHLRAMRAFG